MPAVETVLLISLLAVNPGGWTARPGGRGAPRWPDRAHRRGQPGVAGPAVNALLHQTSAARPGTLLLAALQIWSTNVLVFALAFWELDRGGPVARTQQPRRELPPADFRFSQDENDGAVPEVAAVLQRAQRLGARLGDYLYVSLTNSSAFSPTDTMPLTARAKRSWASRRPPHCSPACWSSPRGVGQLGS